MKKLLLVVFISIFSLSTFAQQTATVKGIVADRSTKETLIGASVTLKSKEKSYRVSTTTGLDGSYIFKNVPAGKYELEAKYIGYNLEKQNFDLKLGAFSSVNLMLEAAASNLNEVTIQRKADGGSDIASRQLERKADQVINAVSARAIEISPDLTIANVTQRVSGVSVERSNNGEGQYAIIRGMDKRYNYTLVNGVKIPSPDNKNRYVPLDIFPADIVDRMEVYKSLTPNLEGDAIGGGINLVLKDAPEQLILRANAAMGLAGAFFNGDFTQFDRSASKNTSPRLAKGSSYSAGLQDFPNNPFKYENKENPVSSMFGLTVGNRTKDKKFGALASISYQNTYRGTNTVFFDTDVDRTTNEPSLKSVQRRNYSIQQERTGVHTKFDYRINKANKLDLYASYINLGQNEFRFMSDTTLNLGRNGVGTGRVTNTYRSNRVVQQIYSGNLHGDHALTKDLSLNWSAVYAKATSNEPDRANLTIVTGRVAIVDGSGNITGITQQPALLNSAGGGAQSRIWSKNSDEDKTGYLNLLYGASISGVKFDFSMGGMYRDKTRTSSYDDYSLVLAGSTTQVYDGNINNNSFAVQSVSGSATNPLNYDFDEKIAAGYFQVKFALGRLQTIAGVRYENTKQDWVTAADPNQKVGAIGSKKYDDLLPSINFKYRLADKQSLRASYYSAISRPGFYELIPHSGGNPEADYQELGNPYLKRILSDNFDLRYEFFPKALDQLLVGVFYKDIKDPIEYALVNQGTSIFYTAGNFGNATNYGFEMDLTKYFNKFGIRANYTYTKSEITTSKTVLFRDAATTSLTQRTENETRPLQGQSTHIANFSLLFKDTKSGLDAQLAMVYTGPRINTVSPFLGNDIWQKGAVQLDLSAEKNVYRNFSIYMKINNLLNTSSELEIRKPYAVTASTINQQPGSQTAGENVFIRKDIYKQFYLLGLRYKL